MAKTPDDQYSDEEIARRTDAFAKRVLNTPPQHKTAKGEKANPPKKRGRPSKKGSHARPLSDRI